MTPQKPQERIFQIKSSQKKGNKFFQSYIEDSKHFKIMKNEKSRTSIIISNFKNS